VSQLELFRSGASSAPGLGPGLWAIDVVAAPPIIRSPARFVATDLERLVEAYLISALDNDNTRRAYRANLARAIKLFAIDRLADLSIGHLVAFRAAVVGSGLASSSQVQLIFSLRGFLSWADEVAVLPFPLKAARVALRAAKALTVSPPAILTIPEAMAVLELARGSNGMRAMVLILLGAGLRVTEMCGIECRDVVTETDRGACLRVRGKGKRDRLVPLHPPVVAGIAQYLASTGRNLRSPGRLFLAHDRGAGDREAGGISARSARRRVGRLLRQAGISKPVRVHGFRHTFSVEVVRAGGSPFHLQKLLGHASVVTTQKYLEHLGVEDLRDAIPLKLVGG
jgi:site-specific recombinase XerD